MFVFHLWWVKKHSNQRILKIHSCSIIFLNRISSDWYFNGHVN